MVVCSETFVVCGYLKRFYYMLLSIPFSEVLALEDVPVAFVICLSESLR